MASTPPVLEKRTAPDEYQPPRDAEQTQPPSRPSLSKARQFLIASAPCVVWFAGVGLTIRMVPLSDTQTMQICGVGFLLPVIQERLNSSDGEVQWASNLT